MYKTTLLATVFASAAATAFAGALDEPVVEAPVIVAEPVAPFWEGAYVGGQIGYSYGDFDLNLDTRPGDFNDDSVIGGLHAGYLFSAGNGWYVGPEFQYDFADVSVTDPDTGDTASFDEIARLKVIAGREVGNGLFYGSAGIAYADFDSSGAGSTIDSVFDGFNGSETNYVIGLGYDYRIGDNFTVGGEYQFHRFNDIGAAGGDVDVNTLHVKAAYRF